MQRRQNNSEEDLLFEVGMEGRGKTEGQRIYPASDKRRSCNKREILSDEYLLEEITSVENLTAACKKVKSNNGRCGVDEMDVKELPIYLRYKGEVQTKPSQASGNTQSRRKQTRTWNPDSNRQACATVCPAGTQSILRNYLEKKLHLKVNESKSAVDKVWKRKFLGFSFYKNKDGIKIRVHEKSIQKLKEKIKTRFTNLVKLGFSKSKAWMFANTRKGYWRIANSHILNKSLTNKYLESKGLLYLSQCYKLYRTAVCRTACTVV